MNADVRLRRLEREYEGRIELRFKAFLLRPRPRSNPGNAAEAAAALEKFRRYTKGWQRIASEPDAGELRLWSSEEGPPSHSVPAHLVAKAAARISRDAFSRMHERLLRAYFVESRDISRESTLRALWNELGLEEEGFSEREDPALFEEVLAEHDEALRLGATGVPAVRLENNEAVIVGAQPAELYRRWVERTLSRLESSE